jgi:hypothetical protein
MRSWRVGGIVLAAALSAALIAGCAGQTRANGERPPVTPSSRDLSSEGSRSPSDDEEFAHELNVGKTVDIHGAKITVTSAKDSPDDLAGMSTFVVHVKFENQSDDAPTVPFDHLDWRLEYSNGERGGNAIDQTGLDRAVYARDEGAEGDIYFTKEWGVVSRVIYTPEMFDWRPEVTAWDVK